jgi:PAS domain S-box-containing protein
VTYFSPSAEQTFGYRASETIGRELADLIVPTLDRIAHRRGLARYLGTGEPMILGQRLEMTAMRSDGSEFPVELTVTRIDSAEGQGFIGFVRDITERVSAEQELRAARDRIELIANEQAAGHFAACRMVQAPGRVHHCCDVRRNTSHLNGVVRPERLTHR